jgi:hypothetical protein
MYNMKISALLYVLLIFTSACRESPLIPENENQIYGVWIDESWSDNTRILKRSDEFQQDKYGFMIFSSGKFIERKNSGWCGTPPIAYENFEGEWEFEEDDILKIEVGFWGGVAEFKFRIVSISFNELQIEYIYDN